MWKRNVLAVPALVLGLVAAACGSSSTTGAQGATATPTTAPTAAGAFPVTIEHKYGTVTIPAAPVRVVSVGFSDQDWLLALGVQPVGVREWYGAKPYATWEWAQDELGDAKPTVLGSAELNFEAVAALKPDLIVGVSSGMTDADYAKLSQIAPTVVQPKGYIDFGTPWEVATEIIARAVGRVDAGKAVIDRVQKLFAAARAAHPEFAGATAAVSFVVDGKPGAYASQDGRSRVMKDLGFTIPARFDELAGSAFYFSVSAEKLDVLDTDVLVWIVGSDAGLRTIAELSLRPSLRAVTEGREVVADALLSGAFSFGSPLSLEYLLTKLVPELALAVDGKPATVVPSATLLARPGGSPTTSAGATAATTASAPAAAASTLTPEQQTVAEAFAAVFDSKVAFDAKSSSLAEPTVVRTAAEAYGKAGSAMGGIILKPTAVAIQGDTAVITYDVLFGGTAAYKDLSKTITRVDGHWVVPTKEFCAFLSSARVPCP